jgi:hypothetical protein
MGEEVCEQKGTEEVVGEKSCTMEDVLPTTSSVPLAFQDDSPRPPCLRGDFSSLGYCQ